MTTGTVWGITLIILGALLALGGLQLFVAGAFPGVVGQASRNLRREKSRLLAACGIGLGAVVFTALLGVATGALPGGAKIIALFPLLAVAMLLAAGLAAVSHTVGTGLGSSLDAKAPSRRLLRGAVASELAYVVPVLGWFFLLPLALIMGSGAAVMAIFQADKRREAVRELRVMPHTEAVAAA